jgi:hypothetical protein
VSGGDADREHPAGRDGLHPRQAGAVHGEARDGVAAGVDREQQPMRRVVGERVLRGERVQRHVPLDTATTAGAELAGPVEPAVGTAGEGDDAVLLEVVGLHEHRTTGGR